MDLCNWLAHWGDHRIGALWRIHALHHSQEELSVLTSFRAHPLMHTNGFLLATVPVLLLTGAHPLAPVLITVYVCLGTLPHTNVRWSYGPLGRVLVSPAYHRLHHAVDGRQEANLGVVLTVWDVWPVWRAFPARGLTPVPDRAGRPARAGGAGRLKARRLRRASSAANSLSRLRPAEAKRSLAAQAARRQKAPAGRQRQRLRRPRHQRARARGPVEVVCPQFHVAEIDPEQVRSAPLPPPPGEDGADAGLGHAPVQRDGFHDVERVDHAVDKRAVLAATGRLPRVQRGRT